MLNKIFKIIHNKNSKFLKFVFFLRYLFVIFLISTTLFLLIPIFFNYEKKAELIINRIFNNYDLKIKDYEKINFKPLPIPKIEFKDVSINLDKTNIEMKVKNLEIVPKIFSIYNEKNFQIKKIILKDNQINIDASLLKVFITKFANIKNKYFFDNLNLKIFDEDISLTKIERIKYANYGYNKYIITGKIFEKKFKSEIKDNFKDINFNLSNSGISTNITFAKNKKNNSIKGIVKSKILNTNIKFNFDYDNKKININDLYLRNKNFVLNNDSLIILHPFLEINTKTNIDEFNFSILKKINYEKLLKSKDFIKKINIKNVINFKSKKFSPKPIKDLELKIDAAYGRLNYSKKILISDSILKCEGDINLIDEFSLLTFNCSLISDNKKKLFKKFLKNKFKDEKFMINAKGNLSLINKKINFKSISIDENYKASKEDMKYFKETFENIIFDESFFEMFNLKKIERFIVEIS